MKAKYFLLVFILLTLSGFIATFDTRAADYELGVSDNSELILEVKTIDEEGLEELFQPVDLDEGGYSWRGIIFHHPIGALGMAIFAEFENEENLDEVGAKLKLKIDWINESDDYLMRDREEDPDEDVETDAWILFFDIWSWVDPDNDFNPEPDFKEESGDNTPLFIDPDDYNRMLYDNNEEESCVTVEYLGLLGVLLPTPVADYLDELEWMDDDTDPNKEEVYYDEDEMTWEYDLENTKLTLERTFAWDDDPEDIWTLEDTEYEDFKEEWTWDESSGWLSLYQLMNDDDEVIYEVAAASAIPGYELPILLGVTVAFTIGLIYVIKKRK